MDRYLQPEDAVEGNVPQSLCLWVRRAGRLCHREKREDVLRVLRSFSGVMERRDRTARARARQLSRPRLRGGQRPGHSRSQGGCTSQAQNRIQGSSAAGSGAVECGADRSVRPAWSVAPQKALAIILVAKRFSSSWPRHGKRTRAVAARQAGREIGTQEIFVQETGVEAVPGADCIDCRDVQ